MKKILAPGRNCWGVYDTSRTGLLIDGKNYFRAFYEAARDAERYILIAGWQFERSVTLLRGSDLASADGPVRLDRFLSSLCEKNPRLEIFILMWDFSPVVALDKEWFNKLILDLTANDRIHFRFDSSHALYASHHQKLVVIDGRFAFVGGLDLSANGWDDRMHWSENSGRVLTGEQFEPYHDVQSFLAGPVAWELAGLFQRRWLYAGGPELSLAQPARSDHEAVKKILPLAARKVAISETRAQTLVPLREPIRHIRQLYLDAIAAAERVIYLETQYFSSQTVYQALKERMTADDRPCPEIVLILPKRLHTFFEDLSLSTVQAKMLKSLSGIAARRSCAFGIYYTAAALRHGVPEKTTYIHSKILLVDDRFLSVGSANATNRSMGMDTELNVSWEADADEQELIRSIRRVRANLLAEHTGLRKLSQRRALGMVAGLVDYLNSNSDQWGCRLRKHTMESFLGDISWAKELVPDDLSIDPERPLIEESIYEMISKDKDGIFAKGILLLNELALAQPVGQLQGETVLKLEVPERLRRPLPLVKLNSKGNYRWYIVAAIGVAIAAAVWLLFDP